MTALKYSKCKKVYLREVGLDERWLQDKIAEDPSILGLGETFLIQREKLQPKGRLDLLLADSDYGVRYVTEVQLGALDESHIIRTIEYWDIERKRYPQKEHIAVIVAEDVTSRFLNVLSLIKMNIPIVVLQLDCVEFQGNIFLNFIKILEHIEQEDEVASIETTDASYWEDRSSKDSMSLMHDLKKIYSENDSQISLTYNKYHIALRGEGRKNYAWFRPRKSKFVNLEMLFLEEDFEKAKSMAEEAGMTVSNPKNNKFFVNVSKTELSANKELFAEFARLGKKASQ